MIEPKQIDNRQYNENKRRKEGIERNDNYLREKTEGAECGRQKATNNEKIEKK